MFNQELLLNLNFKEKWREWLMGLFLFIGLGFIFFGLWLVANVPSLETKVVLSEMIEEPQENIVVEIAGAIRNPGTYVMGEGSRVSTLIEKSGGFSPNADRSYVALELNLAQKLSDEEKVYVNFLGESIKDTVVKKSDQRISINSASQSQLEELEGIGEKRALEIILQRPYKSINDLVTRKVLSETILKNNEVRIKL